MPKKGPRMRVGFKGNVSIDMADISADIQCQQIQAALKNKRISKRVLEVHNNGFDIRGLLKKITWSFQFHLIEYAYVLKNFDNSILLVDKEGDKMCVSLIRFKNYINMSDLWESIPKKGDNYNELYAELDPYNQYDEQILQNIEKEKNNDKWDDGYISFDQGTKSDEYGIIFTCKSVTLSGNERRRSSGTDASSFSQSDADDFEMGIYGEYTQLQHNARYGADNTEGEYSAEYVLMTTQGGERRSDGVGIEISRVNERSSSKEVVLKDERRHCTTITEVSSFSQFEQEESDARPYSIYLCPRSFDGGATTRTEDAEDFQISDSSENNLPKSDNNAVIERKSVDIGNNTSSQMVCDSTYLFAEHYSTSTYAVFGDCETDDESS